MLKMGNLLGTHDILDSRETFSVDLPHYIEHELRLHTADHQCRSLPEMSRMSPGQTVRTQSAARRHSNTFISTPDWSVTTIDAKGTKVPPAGPDLI